MKLNYTFIFILSLIISGCIFSGSDIEERKLVEPYYITYSGIKYELIVKEKGASTNKVLISSNIDSIGWYSRYIFGKIDTEYFIINRDAQNFEGKYNSYFEFIKAKKLLELKSKMLKTSELFHNYP